MQVTNNATDPSKAVDPSKEAQKANQTKIDPNKHIDPAKPDAASESERLAQSAKDFAKGLATPSQSVQATHDAAKVDEAKETVKLEAFRREREKSVKA